MRTRSFAFLAALVFTSGCGRTLPVTNDASAPMPATAIQHRSVSTAAVTFKLPPIHPAGAPIPWSSSPTLLSSATSSLFGSIGSKSFGPIALSTQAHYCGQSSSGLACTVTVRAPVGQVQTLTITTKSSDSWTSQTLATGTETVNVFAKEKNVLSAPTLYAIAAKIGARPLYQTLVQGQYAIDPVVIYGIDFAGKEIPSINARDVHGKVIDGFTIDFKGWENESFPPGPRSQSRSCCGIDAHLPNGGFVYSGLQTGTESFSLSDAPLPTTQPRFLTIVPGSTKAAHLLIEDYAPGPYLNALAEFSMSASGNVAPIRSLLVNYATLLAEGPNGDFWLGDTRYTSRLATIGRLKAKDLPIAVDSNGHLYSISNERPSCSIFEYPADTFGAAIPIREIDFLCPEDGGPVTVDGNGNIFASINGAPGSNPPDEVFEYAPYTGSGYVPPIRTIAFPTWYSLGWLDTDAAGNLYADEFTGSLSPRYNMYKFAPGETTGQHVLSGIPLTGPFASDDAGDLYVAHFGYPGNDWIQVFAPGASTPARAIRGAATGIKAIYGLAIPRVGH
jgi:hypothetical protein